MSMSLNVLRTYVAVVQTGRLALDAEWNLAWEYSQRRVSVDELVALKPEPPRYGPWLSIPFAQPECCFEWQEGSTGTSGLPFGRPVSVLTPLAQPYDGQLGMIARDGSSSATIGSTKELIRPPPPHSLHPSQITIEGCADRRRIWCLISASCVLVFLGLAPCAYIMSWYSRIPSSSAAS